jgi:hypothetical protein
MHAPKAPLNRAGVNRLLAIAILVIGWFSRCPAAEPVPADAAALAQQEAVITRQFAELEKTFLRLADLLAATDPRRATLLKTAFEHARDGQVSDRLAGICRLLEQGQLLEAGSDQASAIERLESLLRLLQAGDPGRETANTKQQVREYLSRINKLIASQRGIEGATEAGGQEERLADQQERLANETELLTTDVRRFAREQDTQEPAGVTAPPAAESGGKMPEPSDGELEKGDAPSDAGESKGEPSAPASGGSPGEAPRDGESSPSSDAAPEADGAGEEDSGGDDEASRGRRTARRLAEAERRMREARERIDDAARREAREEQEKAVEELEAARAELEEILRQLREEEVERLLVQLEARVRAMLRIERAVQAGFDRLVAEGGLVGRERQLESARLGREQEAVTADATRALTVVRDDGTAVAIPQALAQIRDDSQQLAARLLRGELGLATRGVIEDVVVGLEELLAALEKAQREQQEDRQEGRAQGRPGEPGEQPLVDKLAELKMIRTLQMRVNRRTGRLAQLLTEDSEQADGPEMFDALQRLADRQREIQQAASDIVAGRTE